MGRERRKTENLKQLTHGLKMGIPIAVGYFVVAFSLGINAAGAGFTAGQAAMASFLCMASAGEYALFSLAAASATYFEVAVMELVVNARYLLMSCALSQKLSPDIKTAGRLHIGLGVTDEMFGVAIAQDKVTHLFYFGMMIVSTFGWTLGTWLGVTVGNVLPGNVVTALSVGLYGMFIAIVVPAAKHDRHVLYAALAAAVLSAVFSFAPVLSKLPEGIRTIGLTVLVSAIAALVFPLKKKGEA